MDFQPGRYLQLEPRAVVHQSLQELNRAQAQLRTESLRDDGGQSYTTGGRRHRGGDAGKPTPATAAARPRKRCWTPATACKFAVLVLDRASGQMLSGARDRKAAWGEKEIIASYVLTVCAELRAVPHGASRPVFGTIVLDEAFSKPSQAVAARIIQALHREFVCTRCSSPPTACLLRKPHAQRRGGAPARRTGHAGIAARWEEIDAFAAARKPSSGNAA